MAHKISNGLQVSNSNFQRNGANSREKQNDRVISDKDCNRKETFNKRPEVRIYRPGMGLLHKNPKAGDDMPDGEEHPESKIDSNSASDLNQGDRISVIKDLEEMNLNDGSSDGRDSRNRKSRNKRPDQQVYVPRLKIAALANSPTPNEKEQNANVPPKPPLLTDIENREDSRRSPDYSSIKRKTRPVNSKPNKTPETAENDFKSNKNQYPLNSFKATSSETKTDSQQHTFGTTVNGHYSVHQNNLNDNSVHNVNQLAQFNKRNARNEGLNNHNRRKENSLSSNNGGSNSKHESSYKDNTEKNNGRGGGKKKPKNRRNDEGGRNRRSSQDYGRVKVESIESEDWDLDLPPIPAAELSILATSRALSQEDIFSNGATINGKEVIVDPKLTRSCESPFKTVPGTVSSPKGRGRSRPMVTHANERLTLPGDAITNTNILTKAIPENFEKVPTLIYERSRKLDDFTASDTFPDHLLKNQAEMNDSRWPKKTDAGNKLSLKSNKDLPRFQRSQNDSLNSTRDLSEFQQNPPPRFQRNNQKDLNKQSVTYMTEELALEKAETTKSAGIIRIPWDARAETHNNAAPVTQPIHSSWDDYNHPQHPHHFITTKQLYDPMCIEKQNIQPTPVHPPPVVHQFHPNFMGRAPVPKHYPINPAVSCRMPGLPFMEQYSHMHPGTLQNCNPTPYAPYNMGHPGFTPMHAQTVPTPHALAQVQQPSFSDQIIENSKRVKPIVEKNLHDAGLLEREMNSYLIKGLDNVDAKALGHCRWKLQLRYENIVLADPRFCADRNVEHALWKSAFHQVIEAYRRLKVDQQPLKEEEINRAIINLVEEGTVFYESLLEKLQETFGINLSQFIDTDTTRPRGMSDNVKMILISAQKIYICLGDLARYREQATNTTSYGKARSWYLKAQQIAPKNGRPYYQLAILAIYARRKLDAVYYYMRSLAASNPFLSARESLLSLFDEARRKYEATEKKHLDSKAANKQESDHIGSLHKQKDRVEIWISPTGLSRQHSSSSKEDSLKHLTTVELNKRFVLSFLHVHGKLFTKVGREMFTETTNQMLHEFRCLLQCTPAPLSSARLLQLLAINMFGVANTAQKGPPMDVNCRPLLQEQALQVSLAMVAIVIERSTVLLKEHLSSSDYPSQLASDDLTQLLPTLKVWTDWMGCQKALWSPLPSLGDLRTGCKGDIWALYANLLNMLSRIREPGIQLEKRAEPNEGYEAVTLPEDTSLACFVPLLGAPQNTYYGVKPVLDKERARIYLRMIHVQFFGDYLTGITMPYLKFDIEKKCFISLVTTPSEENTESGPNTNDNSSDEDGTIEDGLEELEEDCPNITSDSDNEVRRLWCRQEMLKKAKDRDDRREQEIQEVLRENRAKRPMEIRIVPRYLIPDTNCFIYNLSHIRMLIKTAIFNLVVPLVVINELDGLAKGVSERPSSSCGNSWSDASEKAERVREVGQAAKEAMLFLEERFASREPKLRSITSKGSILDTISFRSEEYSDNKGTNDDLILSCCLFYCKDSAQEYMPKDSSVPVQLYREVVLLTDDRNLRVRALSSNVPVRTILEFVKWVNLR